MGFDFNQIVDDIFSNIYTSEIIKNPLYMSILIMVCLLIISFVILRDMPENLAPKIAIYGGIMVATLLFLHNTAIKESDRTNVPDTVNYINNINGGLDLNGGMQIINDTFVPAISDIEI